MRPFLLLGSSVVTLALVAGVAQGCGGNEPTVGNDENERAGAERQGPATTLSSRSAGSTFASAPLDAGIGAFGAPTPRSEFLTVFSRNVGGVFLVGGKDAESGGLLNEVRLFRFGGIGWSKIVPQRSLGQVDAATFSVADGKLWVLDHRRSQHLLLRRTVARLLRIDPWTTATEELGEWSWDEDLWNKHFLALDRDGGVLLLAASHSKCRSRVARIRVDGQGDAYAEIIEDDVPYTTDGPLVDRDEYGFIVRNRDAAVTSVVRRANLEGRNGHYGLGSLFDRGLLGDLLAPVHGLLDGQDCGCDAPPH
jgi:hypothetical protein